MALGRPPAHHSAPLPAAAPAAGAAAQPAVQLALLRLTFDKKTSYAVRLLAHITHFAWV